MAEVCATVIISEIVWPLTPRSTISLTASLLCLFRSFRHRAVDYTVGVPVLYYLNPVLNLVVNVLVECDPVHMNQVLTKGQRNSRLVRRICDTPPVSSCPGPRPSV